MTQVLANSDNVAMVWLAEQLGKDNEYNYVKKYNFFDKTGIDLGGEASGYAPSLKNWQDINRSTVSFGQGISVTPIELLCAYATIANGGKYVYPHMVDKIIDANGAQTQVEKTEGAQVIKPETAKTISTMLSDVVKTGGSYRRLREALPGFNAAAKTGTAQISAPEGGYLENESGLGIFTHSMAGFAPANDPKFAMLVKLDKPKTSLYAESTAEPVFGKIANFLLNYYYRVTPTETPQQ
jgi:cell division protein FtsI (penicillin-binding protein 3)